MPERQQQPEQAGHRKWVSAGEGLGTARDGQWPLMRTVSFWGDEDDVCTPCKNAKPQNYIL